jgi:hypothetical protein
MSETNNQEPQQESLLITPEEAERRRIISLQERANALTQQATVAYEEKLNKFERKGETVKINYETNGRFSTPATGYFRNYAVGDISELAVSKEEDILETIVSILNELNTDKTVKAEEMLMEEFYETLVGLKAQYGGRKHKHKWQHSCQDEVPQDERKLSTSEIDLATLNYVSIEMAEEKLRDFYRKQFDAMDAEDWAAYVQSKYQGKADPSKEEELNSITIKEPIYLKSGENVLEFVFPRIGHAAKGIKMAFRDFNDKVRKLKAKQIHGMPKEERDELMREEVAKLEKEKQKKSIIASRAMSLMRKNGKELNIFEKVSEFERMDINVMAQLNRFFDSIEFGIVDERELVCDLCNESERRVLHRTLNPIELLPSESNNDDASRRELGVVAATVIHM